jgi:copper chaperone NosL
MRARAAVSAAVLLTLAACTGSRPFPIVLGEDGCDHCHMTVTDPRYTAELLTTTGKGYRFDDIGCLAAFLAGGTVPRERQGQAWVNDFLHPGQWLKAEDAAYLQSDSLHTPMGSGLIALRADGPVDSLRAALSGSRLDWAAVMASGGHGTGSAGPIP